MDNFILVGLAIFIFIVVIAVWSTDTTEEAFVIDAEEAQEVAEEGSYTEPPPKPPMEYKGGAGDAE